MHHREVIVLEAIENFVLQSFSFWLDVRLPTALLECSKPSQGGMGGQHTTQDRSRF